MQEMHLFCETKEKGLKLFHLTDKKNISFTPIIVSLL